MASLDMAEMPAGHFFTRDKAWWDVVDFHCLTRSDAREAVILESLEKVKRRHPPPC